MNIGDVPVLTEAKRGCGFRKGGGTYLVTEAKPMQPCGKLPIPLDVCPTCSRGIKPSRGWTWVDAQVLCERRKCAEGDIKCVWCPLHDSFLAENRRMGLLWIGQKFYDTPLDWMEEARKMGVSRRISTVPRDFHVGKTWVLVAHREVIRKACAACDGEGKLPLYGDRASTAPRAEPEAEQVGYQECSDCDGSGVTYTAAVFHAFKPERIEYVCRGDETDEELDRLVERGLVPVRVKPEGEQLDIEEEEVTT